MDIGTALKLNIDELQWYDDTFTLNPKGGGGGGVGVTNSRVCCQNNLQLV